MHSDTSKDSGFTLLEVLVAFVVLSAALVAANQSLSYSLRSFASAKMARAADRVAEDVFAERLSVLGRHGEESGMAADGLKWKLRREPLALSDAGTEITAEKLTLDVTAPTDDRVIRRFVTYRPVPTSEDGNVQ